MHYRNVLARLHAELEPQTYVEIGVSGGGSLARALASTRAIGIDPDPRPFRETVACDYELFRLTSDEFFEQHDLRELVGGPFDLAFIDGMHLFENVLRDFINLERNAGPASIILVHDCLPIDAVTSSRERTTIMWTGDVWKLIPCLHEYRPDLEIEVVDAGPSGLAVIKQLDPSSETLSARYEEICEQFIPLTYAEAGA
jgi:hypothetical protein